MAIPSNKPRDIKNLKARLGRTITPGQAGVPGSFPPGGPAAGGGSVPPPAMGGGFPGGSGGSVPPGIPGGGFPGLGAPPFGRPAPGGAPGANRASANPFAPTPNPLGGARPPAPAAASRAPAPGPRLDPFANASAAAVPATKRVTLVIDDSAVKDDEIGRRSRWRTIVLAVIFVSGGLVGGFAVGSTADKRNQFSAAVQDGKDIYQKIQDVSKTVDQAKALVKQAMDASTGGPGKKATVDYAAIEQLVALKRPFSANEFHRRLYRAFGDGVVDDLFDYYNNVNQLWDGFAALGAKTAGPVRREALAKSAAATDGLLNNEYGMVLTKNGDMFAGGIVFLTVPPRDAAEEKKAPAEKKGKGKAKEEAKDEGIKVRVSSVQGGQEVDRTLYTGQDNLGESFEKYAFMVDKVRSRTILGEQANVFSKFRGDVMDLSARAEKASEVQGRLLKSLGQVAALSSN